MISVEDYLWFADDALDGMVAIVTSLGDESANRAPDLPGANSPYAILTHCLGVMEYWAGQVIAGRVIHRDRPAEFVATGGVEDLVERTREARAQLARDLEAFDPPAGPRGEVKPGDADLPLGRTQGGALFHIYEELAQHRGQLEITRDILRAAGRRLG
jgi:Protein of unknown function (DUF664)